MLSGYENGKKLPTLASLDKILHAMGCGLRDLVEALEKTSPPRPDPDGVGGGPGGLAGPSDPSTDTGPEGGGELRPPFPKLRFDMQVVFGPAADLAPEEEGAFHRVLRGYCRWLDHLDDRTEGEDDEDVAGAPVGGRL